MLETSHLTVAYGAQPRLLTTGLNINSLDEEERQKALKTLKEGLDEAEYMGAKGFAFLSGKYKEETKEESYQALVKSTKELCEYAKAKGMTVALEVFDYDIEKESIIGPVNLAKRFAEDIRKEYDNFGLMVDLSHIPPVSYTHLDVYKRQEVVAPDSEGLARTRLGLMPINEFLSGISADKLIVFNISRIISLSLFPYITYKESDFIIYTSIKSD